jgi:hypothetical protein
MYLRIQNKYMRHEYNNAYITHVNNKIEYYHHEGLETVVDTLQCYGSLCVYHVPSKTIRKLET